VIGLTVAAGSAADRRGDAGVIISYPRG
jgi:hypothetical protein